MAKFKAGDKIVCVKSVTDNWYSVGDILTARGEGFVSFGDKCHHVEEESRDDVWIEEDDFELHQEPQQFNLKTDKWWIATPTPEISKAVQEWLFEQGISWKNGSFDVEHVDKSYLTNIHGAAYPVPESKGFMQTNGLYKDAGLDPEHEIKIATNVVVASVTFPDVISEQEKARKQSIAELEATIAKAQEQIEQLKGL